MKKISARSLFDFCLNLEVSFKKKRNLFAGFSLLVYAGFSLLVYADLYVSFVVVVDAAFWLPRFGSSSFVKLGFSTPALPFYCHGL